MKLLVDEIPYCKDNCIFTEQKWSDGAWCNYCKLTNERCDLDKGQCGCLRTQGE